MQSLKIVWRSDGKNAERRGSRLEWSRLLVEATEAGSEFQVVAVPGKKERVKALKHVTLPVFVGIASYRTKLYL